MRVGFCVLVNIFKALPVVYYRHLRITTMMDILEKLFGSVAKVKIMRLFLFNPSDTFDLAEIVRRCKVPAYAARQEIATLEKIGLAKRRSFFKDHEIGRGKGKRVIRRRATGWTMNESFEYLESLQNLLIQVSPLRNTEIVKRLSRVGKLKLVIVSGVFINNYDTRIDLLVVGDNMRKGTLENTVKTIESEIGREIRYAYFETPDFQYRYGIYDKLIRDILDYPHEKVLDRLEISTLRR